MFQILSNLIESKQIWYHGSNTKIVNFNLGHVNNPEAIDLHGPGIYLTNNIDDAKRYGKYIHEIEIDMNTIKLLPIHKKLNRILINKFINNSTFFKTDGYTNWDDNIIIAKIKYINMLYETYGPDNFKECLAQIWYDNYKNDSKKYIELLAKNYDALEIIKQSGTKHLIVYNTKMMKILTD